MPTVNTTPPIALPARSPVQTGARVGASAEARAKETAREFEATLLSMMLKEMRQTEEPDGLFAGDTGDVWGGMFDLYMGRHLAEAGGFGLAANLERYLKPSPEVFQTPTPHAYSVPPSPEPPGRPVGRSTPT